ncbi:MAG: hypothetical protein J6A25_07810 [Lachnospiraceae bacterium]|nr:hypothetical protein [Lachnospiraceae bacterium]MBO5425404.1 hypothetical protein [Lachnospiraceae bacterium]
MKLGRRFNGKYLGRRYDGWTVVEQERYVAPKEQSKITDNHAQYNYYLCKIDLATKNVLTVYISGNLIRKLAAGQRTMQGILETKRRFVKGGYWVEKNKVHKIPLTSTLYN